MSSSFPPPIPDRRQIQRSIRDWRCLFWLGALLAASPLWGALPGLLRTFGSMEGDISQAASTITGGITSALFGSLVGFGISPFGILLLVFARRRIEPLRKTAQEVAAADQATEQRGAR